MAEQNGSSRPAPSAQNPAFRMMGMPNFSKRLPSRNWMIFLTITGSFLGAVYYDRREKRRVQQKWVDLVAHIAREPLPSNELRRKISVYLAAPPGDGLRNAREYFKEYVKPILVAAATDYEAFEGRREGDIRALVAEQIRKRRRETEAPQTSGMNTDAAMLSNQVKVNFGIHDEPAGKGDLVLGRHTWKEYLRGIHEGWLGPLDQPLEDPATEDTTEAVESRNRATTDDPQAKSANNASTLESKEEGKSGNDNATETEKEKGKEVKENKGPLQSYLLPSSYDGQPLPPSVPQLLEPTSPIPFPNILGFLNTPIRIYRFLNKRYLADSVGREVAALVLANSHRPYSEFPVSVTDDQAPTTSSESSSLDEVMQWEQSSLLADEEKDWHKSVHRAPADSSEVREREWLDEVVVDPRIGSRMRRFDLTPKDQARAERIFTGEEYILGEERPVEVPLWQRLWNEYGWGTLEDPRKSIIGNLDSEDGK